MIRRFTSASTPAPAVEGGPDRPAIAGWRAGWRAISTFWRADLVAGAGHHLLAGIPRLTTMAWVLLATVCVIQWSGRLPPLVAARLAAMLAFALVGIGLLIRLRSAARPPPQDRWGRRAAWLVGAGACLLIPVLPVLQIHAGLQARLPAALDGEMLTVVGDVDAMPQRHDFGDRIVLRVRSCRRSLALPARGDDGPAAGSDAPASDEAGGTGDCGGLQRVQLDWGLEPARSRVRRLAADAEAARSDPGSASRPDLLADSGWPVPGERWQVVVRLRRPVAPVNPGGFDAELRWLQAGIGAVGRVRERRRLGPDARGNFDADAMPWDWGLDGFRTPVEAARTRIRDALEDVHAQRVDDPTSGRSDRWPLLGIVAGLSIGDQSAISPTLWGLFSRTGVSHLVAISGSHVTMLAAVVAALTRGLLGLLARRRLLGGASPDRGLVVLVVAVACAFAYALLSGWGIPAQRTCWMLLVAAVMARAGRAGGVLTPVLLAAGLLVAIDPWAVGAAGFWLSFVAVAAILLCAAPSHGLRADRQWMPAALPSSAATVPSRWRLWGRTALASLGGAVSAQWAATVALVPLVAAFFSMTSVIGPLANAVAIPLMGLVITPLSLAAALLAPVWPALSALVLRSTLVLLEGLVQGLNWLDTWPMASVVLPQPGPWTLLAAMAGAVLLVLPLGGRLRLVGVLGLLPLLAGQPRQPAADALWLTALDIGQGSSLLVESGIHRMLVDTGSGQGQDRSAVQRVLLPALHARGITRIDTLVISHLDAEHAGGAAAAVAALAPRRLVTSFDPRLLPVPDATLAGLQTLHCQAPMQFEFGASTVQVLHPQAVAANRLEARSNDRSCVLRIDGPGGRVLLTADLTARGEAGLVRVQGPRGESAVRADVLLVPRQGGRGAATEPWLAAVSPRLALVQVGYRNRHGHPYPEVVERIEAAGAELLRTDRDGAVRIEIDGQGAIRVRRARQDQPPYWRLPVTAPSSPRPSPRPRRAPDRHRTSTGRRRGRRAGPA